MSYFKLILAVAAGILLAWATKLLILAAVAGEPFAIVVLAVVIVAAVIAVVLHDSRRWKGI